MITLKRLKHLLRRYIYRLHLAIQYISNADDRTVYLTIDDGPSENTEFILHILNYYHVNATFFVTEMNTGCFEKVREIASSGNAIGLHSCSHDYSLIYRSSEDFFADIDKERSDIKDIVGVDTKIIRFPGGTDNTISMNYCKGIMKKLCSDVNEENISFFDWDVEVGSPFGACRSLLYYRKRFVMQAAFRKSVIVLAHDWNDHRKILFLLPYVIEFYQRRHYTFKILTDDIPSRYHKPQN